MNYLQIYGLGPLLTTTESSMSSMALGLLGISTSTLSRGSPITSALLSIISPSVPAAEAVLEAFSSGLTTQQRMMVTLANEIAENMTLITS